MNILHVVPEVTPFAATGALADICAAMPRELARQPGLKLVVVAPRYRCIDPARHALAKRLSPISVTLGEQTFQITIFEGRLPGGGVPLYLIDHPVFDRDGLYGENGVDYPDNALRFALLSKGALEVARHLGTWPDIVHAHDWQTAMVAYFARRSTPRPATLVTIHNLALQGLAPLELADELGIDATGGEVNGQLSLLKLGLANADRITTVSPRYSREIQTPALGAGLHEFLRAREGRLTGILNGIDTELWNPASDAHLAVHYDASDTTGKAACKAALQREVGLPVRAQVPLFASVSRLIDQKGLALVVEAGEELARQDLQLVFHGAGEKRFEDALTNLARRYPTKVAFKKGHEDPLTHRIFGGADFYLMPSRFEPCGLAQMVALRYGALPIVRSTGGLDDTVIDHDPRTKTGTGFTFMDLTGSAFAGCVKRALGVYHHKQELDGLIAQGMKIDHGWLQSARRYAEIYAQLAPSKK